MLTREDFYDVLEHFPQDQRRITMEAKKRMDYYNTVHKQNSLVSDKQRDEEMELAMNPETPRKSDPGMDAVHNSLRQLERKIEVLKRVKSREDT